MAKVRPITDNDYLRMLGALRHRAEKADDLSAYAPSFVAVIDPMLLANRNTQVIFGRNGTGKTHILKCFEEIVIHNVDAHRILPAYFDMRTLDMSRVAPDVREEGLVEAFFSTFLYEIVEKLLRTVDTIAKGSTSYSNFVSSAPVQTKVRAAAKRLRRAFDRSHMREHIDTYTKSIRTTSGNRAPSVLGSTRPIKVRRPPSPPTRLPPPLGRSSSKWSSRLAISWTFRKSAAGCRT
jgi:hypothetical protein